MKLTGIGGASSAGPASKTASTAKTSGGGFAESLASLDQAEETQGASAPAAVGGIASLVAAQSVNESLDREAKKRLVEYGNDLLDKLEELRHGLLLGSISKDKLIAMAQMVRSRRDHVPDPYLSELLNDIELRVEVELAKLSARDP